MLNASFIARTEGKESNINSKDIKRITDLILTPFFIEDGRCEIIFKLFANHFFLLDIKKYPIRPMTTITATMIAMAVVDTPSLNGGFSWAGGCSCTGGFSSAGFCSAAGVSTFFSAVMANVENPGVSAL